MQNLLCPWTYRELQTILFKCLNLNFVCFVQRLYLSKIRIWCLVLEIDCICFHFCGIRKKLLMYMYVCFSSVLLGALRSWWCWLVWWLPVWMEVPCHWWLLYLERWPISSSMMPYNAFMFQFRFAGSTEKLMMLAGLVAACLNGAALPLMIVVFREMTNLLINDAL